MSDLQRGRLADLSAEATKTPKFCVGSMHRVLPLTISVPHFFWLWQK